MTAYNLQARFTDTEGNGVGHWRTYYNRAEDVAEAVWAARHLIPGCQVRIRYGRETVLGPMRARELPTPAQVRADMDRYGHVAGWRTEPRPGVFDMRRDLGRAPTAQEYRDARP